MTEIIHYPLSTEKSIRMMESENKLAFVVDEKANRRDVKEALEKLFSVKVVSVNLYHSVSGKKRAYVQFAPENPAVDVATKMGIM